MNAVIGALVAAAGLVFGAGVWVGRLLKREQPKAAGPSPNAELEKTIHEELFKGFVSAASGSLERSRSGAQFVQIAATAVSGLYAGALGLVFAVGTNPLPLRGFAPTIFLAASIAFSAFYLAFLTRGRSVGLDEPSDPLPTPNHLIADAIMFIDWVGEAVARRQAFLRAAVISLAIGVLMLPVPFLSVADEWAEWLPGELPAAESPAAEPESPLVLPDPQFSPEAWPAEVAAIAYQARVDRYLESLDEPAPATDGAENAVALWATLAGIVAVVVTFSLSADRDAWNAREAKKRTEERNRVQEQRRAAARAQQRSAGKSSG